MTGDPYTDEDYRLAQSTGLEVETIWLARQPLPPIPSQPRCPEGHLLAAAPKPADAEARVKAGEDLAQAIRIGEVDGILAALAACPPLPGADAIEFADRLVRCIAREEGAGTIVDFFTS